MNNIINRWLASVVAVLCLFCAISAVANPGKIKDKDQTLTVVTAANSCATAVVLSSSEDNCADSPFAGSCGSKGKDCVCMRKDKFLNWQIDRDARFELTFTGANPLAPNCSLKSGNNQKIQCKVEASNGDFEYYVRVEGCPSAPYDPKIIIRD